MSRAQRKIEGLLLLPLLLLLSLHLVMIVGGFPFRTRRSLSFLSHGGLMEIVSPTAEDHILDCARLCRKTRSGKQLIVLSDNVMLKIKAMAEVLH